MTDGMGVEAQRLRAPTLYVVESVLWLAPVEVDAHRVAIVVAKVLRRKWCSRSRRAAGARATGTARVETVSIVSTTDTVSSTTVSVAHQTESIARAIDTV
jgi:hypothetical protein